MARFSVLFLLFAACMVSCTEKSKTESTVDSVSQQPLVTLFQDGTYTTEDLAGELTIEAASATTFNFSVTVTTANANCTGEAEGTATLDAATQKWMYQDSELSCSLTFETGEGIITITETGTCDHGASCSYNGVYGRTGSFSAAKEVVLSLNTIMDYYLAIPDEHLTCEITRAYTKEQREKAILHKNISNGYMKASFDELDTVQLALFQNKETNQSYLAFVYECGAGCMCTKRLLLEYKGGAWHDRFADMIPDLSELENDDVAIGLLLPEKGTTIKVVNLETRKSVADLLWKKNKFEMVRK